MKRTQSDVKYEKSRLSIQLPKSATLTSLSVFPRVLNCAIWSENIFAIKKTLSPPLQTTDVKKGNKMCVVESWPRHS